MKIIKLTDEQVDVLLTELHSLHSYQWNDNHTHADDCGSKIVSVIESQINEQT